MGEPGKRLGPYELIAELGRGGMGVVFRARRADLAREVALKVLPIGATTELVARFRLEAQLAARLRHPNVVGVHDVGEADGQLYLAMDLIEGTSLDDALSDRLFTPREAAELILQVVEAVGHAHIRGVLHRDIKPGNVLLATDGTAHLADFGLARAVDTTASAKLSRSGTVLGTPAYMSPEQALGRGDIDGRTDVWSCGAMLYELLTQCLPFDGDTAVQVLSGVVNDDPKPVRRRTATVPKELEAIVHRCLEKDPDLRYADAQALATDLRCFLDGKPVAARTITPWRRAKSWVKRNKALAATAAAGVLGVAGVALWLTVVGPELARRARAAHLAALEQAARTAMEAESARLQRVLRALRGPDGRATDSEAAAAAGREAAADAMRTRVLAALPPALAPGDDVDALRAFDAGIAAYAPGPLMARAALMQGANALAYRYDPNGEDGVRGAIALAADLRSRRLLQSAARVLRRLRTRHADAAIAREVSAGLAPVYAQLGDWEQALAAHADAGGAATLDGPSLQVLQAFGRQRQRRTVPDSSGRPFEFYRHREPLRVLDLGERGRWICTPHRAGAPMFRIGADGQLGEPQKLADHLDPGTWVIDVAPGDVDGDGVQDLLCAVTRPGTGSGVVVLSPSADGWTVRAQDLSQGNTPAGLIAGDFDADGKLEAVIPFHWRSGHAWLLHWDATAGALALRKWSPDSNRPWIGGGAAGDLDGDGTIELAIGTSLHSTAEMLLYHWSEREPPRVVGRTMIGHPGDTQIVPDPSDPKRRLLAVMTESGIPDLHYDTSMFRDRLPPFDSLAFLRWDGRTLAVADRQPLSGDDTDTTLPGNSSRGRLAAGPLLLFWADRSEPEEGALIKEGQRLRFALGDMLATPAVLGTARQIRSAHLIDVDGDAESELVMLHHGHIVVHDRWDGPAPALAAEEGEAPTQNEALAGMRAARDLVDARELDAAVALLESIEAGFPDSPLAPDAAHLRLDARLRDTMRRRVAAARDLARGAGGAGQRYDAALAEFETIADAALASADRYRDDAARRRRFLRLEAGAARLGERWKRLADAATAARGTTRAVDSEDEEWRRVLGYRRIQRLFDGGQVMRAGDPALPLIASDPIRARLLPQESGFALTLDSFQGVSVAGVPVIYTGNAVECVAEVELDGSAWSAMLHFGLVPRESLHSVRPRGVFRQDLQRTSARLILHGTTAWDDMSVHFDLGRQRPQTMHAPGGWRGRWKLRWAWLPEADMLLFEVRDAGGRLLFRDREMQVAPLTPGDYVLGLCWDNRYGDCFVGHGQHPYATEIKVTNLTVRFDERTVLPDRRDPATPTAQAEVAGGALMRGDRAAAIRLYRRALEADPGHLRARLYLALCEEREGRPREAGALLAEALRRDPFHTIVTLEDAARPAGRDDRRALGRCIAAALSQLPEGPGYAAWVARAACLGWRGELAPAQAALDHAAAAGDGPALRYLRRKLWQVPAAALNADWEWLDVRGLPLPGTHPPLTLWDAGPEDTAGTLRAAINAAGRAYQAAPGLPALAGVWVAAARLLLADPAAADALKVQANVGVAVQRTGITERALRQRAAVLHDDAMAQWEVVALYANRRARGLTFVELTAAVDRGLRWDAISKGSSDALWKIMGDWPGFPDLVKRAGGTVPAGENGRDD
ncbi:MAG: protein kinase domain-containing protein [Planctomycetota bacterium]|jgi:tetratricopeptide (TPR) repeat protein